jgi:hypothetical protein
MTKLLEQVIADVRKLSDEEQDAIAEELIAYLGAAGNFDPHLSDEQLAELRRRRADAASRMLSIDEVEARLRNRST